MNATPANEWGGISDENIVFDEFSHASLFHTQGLALLFCPKNNLRKLEVFVFFSIAFYFHSLCSVLSPLFNSDYCTISPRLLLTVFISL